MTNPNPSENTVLQAGGQQQTTDAEEAALAEANVRSDENAPKLNDNERVVQAGEMLAHFATRFGMSVTALREMNRDRVADDGVTINSDRLRIEPDRE